VVRGFVLWGWPDIYLPDSVGLDQGGFTLMGGDRERGSARVPPPGAPVVKVRTYGLIGGYSLAAAGGTAGSSAVESAQGGEGATAVLTDRRWREPAGPVLASLMTSCRDQPEKRQQSC